MEAHGKNKANMMGNCGRWREWCRRGNLSLDRMLQHWICMDMHCSVVCEDWSTHFGKNKTSVTGIKFGSQANSLCSGADRDLDRSLRFLRQAVSRPRPRPQFIQVTVPGAWIIFHSMDASFPSTRAMVCSPPDGPPVMCSSIVSLFNSS